MSAGGNPLLEAALAYAARGWPVFPCNPRDKKPLLPKDKDGEGKPIPKSGGLKKASTDPEQITAWWKQWPKALVAIATGHPTKGTETPTQAAGLRMFVLDFDPRVDASGAIFELHGLKKETEAKIGCELPQSLAHLTPSDGVHLYLLQGDDGPPITNRGNLPDHVDVRGLGGYVIAPPSVMADNAEKGQGGKRYRVHRKAPVSHAPLRLLEVLREKKGAKPAPAAAAPPPPPADPPKPSKSRTWGEALDEVGELRHYAERGLAAELHLVRTSPSGQRNAQLNTSALKIAGLVAAGVLDASSARLELEQAARDNPGNDDDSALLATLESGWSAGLANPRDLKEVASSIRSRRDRRRSREPSGSSPRAAAAAGPGGGSERAFRIGSAPVDPPAGGAAVELEAADRVRIKRISVAWLAKRLEAFADLDVDEGKEELLKLAFAFGRRFSAGFLEEGAAKPLWELAGDVGVDRGELAKAIDDGFGRGFDAGPIVLDLKCARYPMTDFGIAERFRDRYGHDFRFTTAKGWLGWDGRRWRVLDQDKDVPPSELIIAVFDTIRALQRESRRIADTGAKHPLEKVIGPKGGISYRIADDEDPNFGALDYWTAKSSGAFVLFSEQLRTFGRQSEGAGKPSSIANLARQWLTVPIEDFDCEQMAVNALNGTIRLDVAKLEDGKKKVAVRLCPHDRADLITKIAAVAYDPKAVPKLYDASIAWAQPEPATRRYVHQVAGYAITGHTGEHKLWFNYGRGRNGKSVATDAWCSSIGDYSGTIGIESFLDQGIKKRGEAASPDLAKLGGVRMLRASEPERGAKLNAALIKAATGGEPMSVRALHRGFFDLLPRFKLIMAGNSKPAIPDTDDGIWTRMKLIPWRRNIDKPELDPFKEAFPDWHQPDAWPAKDPELLEKIKANELAGVFRRLVEGLVDYLEHGFVESSAVTLATDDYREKSDPLGRFLRLCTVREERSRVKSSEFHACFAAWCKAAGEKEWSAKGFSDALEDKGFTKVRSDGMRWEGLKLIRHASDFVDSDGKVLEKLPDLDADPDHDDGSPAPPRPFAGDGDDDPTF